jgi:hypothetical protein
MMPCYCDIPEEDDQVEIERRAKERMYFDVQSFMTKKQVMKSHKLKISMFPLPDVNTALCKLCCILDKKTMEKVSAYQYQIKWSHKTLWDWYVQHCKDDRKHNGEKNETHPCEIIG